MRNGTKSRLKYALANEQAYKELLGLLELGIPTTGDVFYVDSVNGSDTTNDGTASDQAVATLAKALDLVAADNGDVIVLLPNHNENIGNAQIAVDVDGVTIIGLGRGSTRPRFDFDHANASIDVTADDVLIRNITLLPSVTDVLIGIDVNAAATDVVLEDIEALPGEDGAGVDDFALVVDIKAGCTRTHVKGLIVRQHASAAGYLAGVRLTGASDAVLIEDCFIWITGAGVVAPINGITTLSTKVHIRNNRLISDAEPGIELLTGTTGVIEGNYIFTDLATIAASIVADACARFENYYTEVAPETGVLIGTASADD